MSTDSQNGQEMKVMNLTPRTSSASIYQKYWNINLILIHIVSPVEISKFSTYRYQIYDISSCWIFIHSFSPQFDSHSPGIGIRSHKMYFWVTENEIYRCWKPTSLYFAHQQLIFWSPSNSCNQLRYVLSHQLCYWENSVLVLCWSKSPAISLSLFTFLSVRYYVL